jgi:chaperonin GroES
MHIRPLHDRIVVKRIEQAEKTEGGIFLPGTAKEKPSEGTVLAVGSGRVLKDGSLQPLDVKVGDRVMFGKYSGNEVKVQGEEQVILREDDILAVVG